MEGHVCHCRELDWWQCQPDRHAGDLQCTQDLFGTMLIVDVIVANFWMAFCYTEPVKPKN